jgi:hypothetical protein
MGELACGLSALHHLAAVLIERVVDDPLGGIERVVVFVAESTNFLMSHGQAKRSTFTSSRVIYFI